VVMITAYGDIDLAVKALKTGASDFILKPWDNEKLLSTLKLAIQLNFSRKEVNSLKERETGLKKEINRDQRFIIGASPQLLKVLNLARKVAKTDANVLITGENGTGKELIAQEIHRLSNRAKEVLVTVDMGALTETLFESELFGHVRGAFTDAKEDRAGRFELASNGTLFLDEISNIPIELQAKLLSAIQERKISRVGSNKVKEINIRLISATNSDLNKLVNEGRFRQDLLYRINTVEIHIPPLRERKADIELLVEYYLNIFRKKYNKNNLRLVASTLSKLKTYDWPGNVRELQHTVERAVILCESDILEPHDFVLRDSENYKSDLKFDNYNLESVEKIVIRKVLAKYQGNVTKAADELGLTRTSLYRRMDKFNL